MKSMKKVMDRLIGGIEFGCTNCLSVGPFSLWEELGRVYAVCVKCLVVYEVPRSSAPKVINDE